MTKQHGPRTNLSTEDKKRSLMFTSEKSKIGDSDNYHSSHAHWYLQLRGHVPETDLPIVATSNDSAEVVHHKHGANTVSGSCASPQNYGENQVVPGHDAARSGMSGESEGYTQTESKGHQSKNNDELL